MGKKHKPHSGSKGFYPRVRAKRHVALFRTIPTLSGKENESVKPLNFLGYKAGMTHVFGINQSKGSSKFGQEMMIPCSVIECPPLTVFGIRGYFPAPHGLLAAGDVLQEKPDKELEKKIPSFKKTHSKKTDSKKTNFSFESLEKTPDLSEIRLLCHTNPKLTGIGEKKPDLVEVHLSGKLANQLAFAREMLGKEIKVSDVVAEKALVDVKAVSKGKGFQGVVKRAGVKIHRPKSKKHRSIGSIGAWHPPIVMWTVPRPGQMGYHNRTEYNKKVIKVSEKVEEVNPQGGFTNYGTLRSAFLLLTGSVPGALRRPIGIRVPMRPQETKKFNVTQLSLSRVSA